MQSKDIPISSLTPRLRVLYPEAERREIPLRQGVTVLGRGIDADASFDDELVSRRHCEIRRIGSAIEVKDLGSTNGTFIDGEKIGKKALLPQNGLQIGTVMMRLAFGTDEIPPANGVPTEYCTKEPGK